jgi:PAS domain S-box-containing protein
VYKYLNLIAMKDDETIRTVTKPDFNLQLVFDNTDEPCLLIDADLRVVSFNKAADAAARLIHNARLQAGKNILDIVRPDAREALAPIFTEVLKGRKKEAERKFKLSNDATKIFLSIFRPLFCKQRRIVGIIITSRDVTDEYMVQQQFRETNERYELAAKASLDLIWERDFHKDSFYYNETFTKFYGYTQDQLKDPGRVFAEFPHPDDRAWLLKLVTDFLDSDRLHLSYPVHRLLKADGSVVYVEANAMLIRNEDGSPRRMIGVSHDVTARYLMEQQLIQRASELEASNRELERFAYVASHDLQEPLRMVSSFMDLLKKKYQHQLDDTARQYIHFAVDGATRMKSLIMDLLQFSRIGINGSKKELTDLNEVLRQLVQEFTFTLHDKNAKIEVLPLPRIVAIKSQIEQVFRNLISNALKYNESSRPIVHVGYLDEGDHYRFYIRDNGIGIQEKYYEKIFVIFQQLHTKNKYEGTGIGLAITRKIIEQHNGRIWVQSSPGAGSTFYFTIPKTS